MLCKITLDNFTIKIKHESKGVYYYNSLMMEDFSFDKVSAYCEWYNL